MIKKKAQLLTHDKQNAIKEYIIVCKLNQASKFLTIFLPSNFNKKIYSGFIHAWEHILLRLCECTDW